jgi:hypothetical protein
LKELALAKAEKLALPAAGKVISPKHHQEKAPALEELTDTAADSVGRQF